MVLRGFVPSLDSRGRMADLEMLFESHLIARQLICLTAASFAKTRSSSIIYTLSLSLQLHKSLVVLNFQEWSSDP